MNPEYQNPEKLMKRKPRAWVSFGMAGHEFEYVFSTSEDKDIPTNIADVIEQELGNEWEVLYRNTRIEIRNKKQLGFREDEKVNKAIAKALGENYTFTPAK